MSSMAGQSEGKTVGRVGFQKASAAKAAAGSEGIDCEWDV